MIDDNAVASSERGEGGGWGGVSGPDVEEEEEGKDEKEAEKEQEDDSAASVAQSKATKRTRACTRARTQPLCWKWESAAFNGKICVRCRRGAAVPTSTQRDAHPVRKTNAVPASARL